MVGDRGRHDDFIYGTVLSPANQSACGITGSRHAAFHMEILNRAVTNTTERGDILGISVVAINYADADVKSMQVTVEYAGKIIITGSCHLRHAGHVGSHLNVAAFVGSNIVAELVPVVSRRNQIRFGLRATTREGRCPHPRAAAEQGEH